MTMGTTHQKRREEEKANFRATALCQAKNTNTKVSNTNVIGAKKKAKRRKGRKHLAESGPSCAESRSDVTELQENWSGSELSNVRTGAGKALSPCCSSVGRRNQRVTRGRNGGKSRVFWNGGVMERGKGKLGRGEGGGFYGEGKLGSLIQAMWLPAAQSVDEV